jgi:hypothetical protein
MTGPFRPPPPQWQPGDPLVIHLPFAGMSRFIIPVLLAMLGAVMLAQALIALREGDATALHLAEVAAGTLSLVLAGFLWFRPRDPAPNLVVLEPTGIRWSDRQSSWAVPWTELAAVSIATSKTLGGYGLYRYRQSLRTVWVRVDLFPGDPGFEHRHPELARFWEAAGGKQCYRIPLGQAEDQLLGLDNGVRMYAQGRYRGVTDEGYSLDLFRDQ